MQLIIDICLDHLEREKNPDTRVQILKALDTIIEHRMFRQYPYNLETLQQTIYEMILFEDEEKTGGYSIKEREWMSTLNLKFELMKLAQK
mmetsp:Transcript_38106/g.36463  ORF Transcript_38106/g.36463 Transcript_38106/m.36463 type:complete len:90 (+) Transcript_38106:366-635(+)